MTRLQITKVSPARESRVRGVELVVWVSLATTLGTGCVADAIGERRDPNVYGTDDRRDWYVDSTRLTPEENARFRDIGASTVGMFVRDRHLHDEDPTRILLCGSNVDDYPEGREDECFTRTLDWSVHSSSDFGDDELALCSNEPFRLQPSIGRCSGTLIAPDLVLTAGHCFDESDDPTTSVFVFNWRLEGLTDESEFEWRPAADRSVAFWVTQPVPGMPTLTRDDVYHVVKAFFRDDRAERLRPSGSSTNSPTADFAIVRLDRPVALPRRPAAIDYSETHPAAGTPLVVAGFGKGLPLKIDDGARALESWYCDPEFNPALFCNLHDGYSGGSGSGVFTTDGRLVGSHRGSASDFILDESRGCFRSRVVDEDVPDGDFPAAAHGAAWAIEAFCEEGFAPETPICGDPELRVESCPGDAIDAVGDAVCCARRCSTDAECDDPEWGGGCDPTGHCRRAGTCFAGEVWERDACGRPVHRIEGSEGACGGDGDRCEAARPLALEDAEIPVSLEGLRDRHEGSCGGAFGREAVWRLELPEARWVELELDGDTVDWTLYLRRGDCEAASEVGCAAGELRRDPRIEGPLEAGAYFLFADHTPRGRPELAPPPPMLRVRIRPIPETDMPDPEEGGCGCRTTSPPDSESIGLWLTVLTAGLWLGRRRSS